MDVYLRNVCCPFLVWLLRLKVTLQHIRSNPSRFPLVGVIMLLPAFSLQTRLTHKFPYSLVVDCQSFITQFCRNTPITITSLMPGTDGLYPEPDVIMAIGFPDAFYVVIECGSAIPLMRSRSSTSCSGLSSWMASAQSRADGIPFLRLSPSLLYNRAFTAFRYSFSYLKRSSSVISSSVFFFGLPIDVAGLPRGLYDDSASMPSSPAILHQRLIVVWPIPYFALISVKDTPSI